MNAKILLSILSCVFFFFRNFLERSPKDCYFHFKKGERIVKVFNICDRSSGRTHH